MSEIVTVSITGPVGAGKSTIIDGLKKHFAMNPPVEYDVVFLQEPVEEWQNDQGTDWLSLFYGDNSRYGFSFQMKVLESQVRTLEEECSSVNRTKFVITERSPEDGRDVFMYLLSKNGKILEAEYRLFYRMVEKLAWTPRYIVWVDTDPQVCIDRIKCRNRISETHTESSYYLQIVDRYKEIMQNKQNVLRIENSGSGGVSEHCEKITTLMNSLFI